MDFVSVLLQQRKNKNSRRFRYITSLYRLFIRNGRCVNLLLDTHILLWWLGDHPRLTDEAKRYIETPHNLIIVSVVTLWEISIKASLGKIDIPADFEAVLDREPFR